MPKASTSSSSLPRSPAPYQRPPEPSTHHGLTRGWVPPIPLPGWQPAGAGPGRLQQREGSCITIRYNLSPFPLPSGRGDGYCLIPFDSSFIICLPPSSFPVVPPRLLCGCNQSLVSDGCSGGGREGRRGSGGWLARPGSCWGSGDRTAGRRVPLGAGGGCWGTPGTGRLVGHSIPSTGSWAPLLDPQGSAGAEGNALLPVCVPESQGIPITTRLAGPFMKPPRFLSWVSTGIAQRCPAFA